jgi:DNA-binding NtrC family response regulator
MRRVEATVNEIASTDVTVLVTGESGVGKDIVARMLHRRSPRRGGPFVKVNCAALPLSLLESELFGHERGAFTGADHQVKGKFEQAHTGTVFLDEIGELPHSGQAKLLQVLQDHEFSRLGGQREIRVDVRIVAASNRDLQRSVDDGTFREDLFYRLNVVQIRVPPLRERREEIPILAKHFLSRYARKHGRPPRQISSATLERFQTYSWPGNVRELENIIQRIVIVESESIAAELREPLPSSLRHDMNGRDNGAAPEERIDLKRLVRLAAEKAEREALERMLQQVRWRRVEAARRLGIGQTTLRDKIKRYGLGGSRQ